MPTLNQRSCLNYAYPCRNWTFQRFARAAQKKGSNEIIEKNDTRQESNPGPCVSGASALPLRHGCRGIS